MGEMSEKKRHRIWAFFIVGCIVVMITAVFSVLFGSTKIAVDQILSAILHPDLNDYKQLVIRELRIPRTIGCILVGAAFASSGAIMQGVTKNPLADSGLLGVNAGASFALALCLAFLPGLGFSGVVLFSFLGAAASMLLLYCLMSMKNRKLDPVRLVLGGSAISIFLTSLSQAVSIFYNIGYDLTFWTAGGVAGIRAKQLYLAGPVIGLGLIIAIFLSGKVSVLSLGEDAARGLGLDVERSRVFCLMIVLLLAGGAVALAGPVAFVGLMVPHVMQYFVGADYRFVIPASMVGGAFFMLVADILSRVMNAPSETPIGLVFSIIGVPFFIWIARKGGKDFD